MEDIDAYDLGWAAGYDDKLPDCPYSEGTVEHKDWWAGYEQGSNDC